MWRATGVLPTKEIAATSGWASNVSTASRSPCTTLKTPSGKPARCTMSARTREAEGSFSEGFSTKQLPQAMALAIIHSGTMIGKLNGVMPATTPIGSSTVRMSMPVETSELDDPFKRFGMPQANSTFSMPRATSPLASSSTLPCSRVTAAASSSRLASSSSRSRKSRPARRVSDDEPHSRDASTADATTASTSAGEARATSAVARPGPGRRPAPPDPMCPLRPGPRPSDRSVARLGRSARSLGSCRR